MPNFEIQSFPLRPDKGHEFAFHCYIETHVALFSWREKAKTTENVFQILRERIILSRMELPALKINCCEATM